MPWPFQKRLWAIVTWVVGPAPPALIATLSSPVSIRQWAIVTFVDEEGSMPSELRAVFGVLILTPHAVKPSVPSATTWKFAELRRVRRARVNPFERRTTRSRGQVCGGPRDAPRQVLAPHDRAAAAVDRPAAHDAAAGGVLGQQQRLAAGAALVHLREDPAAAGRDVVVAGVAGAEERGVGLDHEGHAGLQPERAAQEDVRRVAADEPHRPTSGTGCDGGLDARGVGLGLCGLGQVTARGAEPGLERGAGRGSHGLRDVAAVLGGEGCGEESGGGGAGAPGGKEVAGGGLAFIGALERNGTGGRGRKGGAGRN